MAETPRFAVRLSEADRAALGRIAEHHGLSDQADAIRFLIRAEDRRLFAARQAARPPLIQAVDLGAADETDDFTIVDD